MKRALLIAAAAAMTLAGTAASAQPYGGGWDRGHDRGHDRYYGDHRHDRWDRDGRWDRREYRGDYRRDYGRDNRHYGRWTRGQYLPPHYRAREYVVYDYGRYRLRPPPRGYHWVRQGDDYLLAAIASGLIAEIIVGGRY